MVFLKEMCSKDEDPASKWWDLGLGGGGWDGGIVGVVGDGMEGLLRLLIYTYFLKNLFFLNMLSSS